MKIAINATILGNKPSGLGVYTRHIIRSLTKAVSKPGDLVIFTPYPELFQDSGATVVRVSRYLDPQYGKWAGLMRLLWVFFVYPLHIRRQKCDVVFSTTHNVVLFTKIPQVVTVHDLLPIKYPSYFKARHLYFRYVLPYLLRKCQAIITVSENTRQDVIREYGLPANKVIAVLNGYNSEKFFPAAERPEEAPYILAVGASYPHKNLERAIEAHGALRWSPKPALLIVGGRRQYLDALRKKVRRENIDGVRFLDYVPEDKLTRLYSHAEFLVFPSLYEGFGFPPLEAMACGCPVIASKASSVPEVCGQAALYIDPVNTEDLRKAMETMLSDTELRSRYRGLGIEQAKAFGWDKAAGGTLDILLKSVKIG